MTFPNVSPPTPQLNETNVDELSLAELVGILIEAWRTVAGVAGGVFLVALLYAVFAPPVYTPTALVQVNQKAGGLSGLETLSSMLEGTALPVDAEIQLAKSNTVITNAVNAAHADVVATPRRLPIFGNFLARRYRGVGPAPAKLGMSGYSWGGDHVDISRFDIPIELHDQDFRLTVSGRDSFRLSDPEGNPLLVGKVGSLVQADSGAVSIVVSELSARPGVSFDIRKRDLQVTVKDVATHLAVTQQGTQSGILQLSLSGNDARSQTVLLRAIVDADLDLNRNLRSEEAAAQIAFLESQLPIMAARVDSARRQLGEYQAQHKVLDLSDESQALLNRLSSIDEAITTAALQRAQLQQQFGGASPALRAVIAQQDTLNRARFDLEQQVAKLPAAAQSVLQLQDNLAVASNLYTGLLTSIQQLQVVKAGSVGDLSVVDLPEHPNQPSGPQRALVVVIGLLLGIVSGIGTAFVRRAFLQRIEDPTAIQSRYALPTLAILPFSNKQAAREREMTSSNQDRQPLLAADDPQDAAVEEIRGLRTSLQFLMPGAERPILCISGPVSGVGKSFISANLARLSADAGMRVIVIDADMRRGHLNRYFGLRQDPGLSAVLSGTSEPAAAIRSAGINGLHVVTAGIYPPNPAELLLRPAFGRLLDYAASEFDLVVIDAPPVLPVTDGIIVARQAAMNVIVAKAGAHTFRELDAAYARYTQNGITPNGFVMNYLRPRAGGYTYGYYYGDKYTYRTSRAGG
jgi:tyrosine-protein kinase Etk/Wzc